MNKTTEHQSTPQQAVGIAISTASGKAYAAVVRQQDGLMQTRTAVFDAGGGLDGRIRQWLTEIDAAQVPTAAGVEVSGIRFLSLTLPPADAAQLPRLVALQAEAKLPLSGDQMRLTWRLSPTAHGWNCTVAAIRKDAAALGTMEGQLTALTPDAAGLGLLVRTFFAEAPTAFVLLRRRVDGVLLARIDGDVLTGCAIVSMEPAQAVAAEVRMELEVIAPRSMPVCLWPDDAPLAEPLAEMLKQSGWRVQPLLPDAAAIQKAAVQPVSEELAVEAVGLAMLALTPQEGGFDFLQSRRAALPQEAAARRRRQRWWSLALTATLLCVCLAAHYGGLKMRVRQLRNELAAQTEGLTAQAVLERQGYRESAARARLDILALLTAIQDSRDGLLLDAIEFEAGKPIRLTASAGGYDAVYGFQKRLAERPGVSGVRLIDPRLDEKTKQVRFTMQFHYQHYTKP